MTNKCGILGTMTPEQIQRVRSYGGDVASGRLDLPRLTIGAEERIRGYVERWLSNPEFKNALHENDVK